MLFSILQISKPLILYRQPTLVGLQAYALKDSHNSRRHEKFNYIACSMCLFYLHLKEEKKEEVHYSLRKSKSPHGCPCMNALEICNNNNNNDDDECRIVRFECQRFLLQSLSLLWLIFVDNAPTTLQMIDHQIICRTIFRLQAQGQVIYPVS